MSALAAIRYFGKDYMLSYRYFAPLTIFVFIVTFVYGVVPNPIMPSYSFTSAALFVIAAWIGIGYIDLEHDSQQMITLLRMRSLHLYYGTKLAVPLMLVALLAVLTVLYPAWTDKFVRAPNAQEVGIAIACHTGLAWLGVCGGALFTRKWFPKWYAAWGGLAIFIVVSLAGPGILNALPEALQIIKWLLPPVHLVMDLLNRYEGLAYADKAVAIVMPYIYSLLLLFFFMFGMARRKM